MRPSISLLAARLLIALAVSLTLALFGSGCTARGPSDTVYLEALGSLNCGDNRTAVENVLSRLGFHSMGGGGNSWTEVVEYTSAKHKITVCYRSESGSTENDWALYLLFEGDVLIAPTTRVGLP